ncbi:GAF domain-containing protein [Streptomyces sp. NRRL WC-3549]|uniref:GAF domain-containing protein n=1 Tax=Streptomyces sp. NRRL WC-3549 TaxID=1463925 RepID=UPI0004CA331A|nr:GAF domain-containing protein [Streptomyces sp. NRRL WC-3549]
MTSHGTGRSLVTPADRDASTRGARLRRLGLGPRPDASFDSFDAFADRVAAVTSAPFSMVNFIDEERQFFAGLHAPAGAGGGHRPGGPPARGGLLRHLARDHGYCPHVLARRKALVLEDVCDYPRFAGNPVVDGMGVRSYLGAPLIDGTGVALGTVCAVDTVPRAWGREGLHAIKLLAGELAGHIAGRETYAGPW